MGEGRHTDRQEEDVLSAARIAAYRDPSLPPVDIRVYDRLTSTNDEAKGQAAAGAPEGTTLIAEQQTGGKGRLGRSFYSPPACGVYLSIILRPKLSGDKRVLLTTAAAVAGAGAIEEACGRPIQIKWVNDLYLEGKKIAGILVEAAADGPPGAPGNYAVVGIGVNVKKSAAGFPAEIADKAGVLCGDGESVSRDRLAAALIDRIWRTAKALEEEERVAEENRKREDFGGGRPDDERLQEKGQEGAAGSFTRALIAEARQRSCVLGKEILVEGRPQLTMATAVGLDPHGFLIVEDGAGRRHVLSSGEISIRYAQGYNVDTRET